MIIIYDHCQRDRVFLTELLKVAFATLESLVVPLNTFHCPNPKANKNDSPSKVDEGKKFIPSQPRNYREKWNSSKRGEKKQKALEALTCEYLVTSVMSVAFVQ